MMRTILLADDSVTIQKVVELTFVDEGYRVVAVGNGAEAAARLAEVDPDIAVLDVHMPGPNGFELCRQVKEWRREVPVLLLVGTFEPFDKSEFAASGADAFLKKPFDSQELLRQVEELLRAAQPPAEAPAAPAAAVQAAAALAGDVDDIEPAWGNLDLEPLPEIEPEAAYAATGGPPGAGLDDTAAGMAGAAAAAPAAGSPLELSAEDVDRIARRVVEILSEKVVREVSWEVVPDLAEVIIKDRIRELEREAE